MKSLGNKSRQCSVNQSTGWYSVWAFICVLILTSVAADPDANAQATATNLYHFVGADGYEPEAGLVQGSDGNFYGTTFQGGTNSVGTVFRISPTGDLTTLHMFNVSDGSRPFAALVEGTDGNFYGTTYGGVMAGDSTVFRISTNGNFTTLHSLVNSEGVGPRGQLVQGTDGNFYGTTVFGGANSAGSIFSISPTGDFSVLHSFSFSDGDEPRAGLALGSDGNFYGTTFFGGNGSGTIFRISPSGVLTNLHSFAFGDGVEPMGKLVEGCDGNFYGTTFSGGANCLSVSNAACGSVFRISPSGVFTNLHSFSGGEGGEPQGGLVLGTDGDFYGTTATGGGGTLYRITPTGDLTNLVTFSPAYFGSPWGVEPKGELVQGSDGNFYGTTSGGGSNGGGTVFRADVGLSSFVAIITCSPLPSGMVSVPYKQTLTAKGGSIPYTWSVVAGSLPTGLGLDVSSGAITGTPTVAETVTFTVNVSDSGTSSVDKVFELTINPLTLPKLTCSDMNINAAPGECSRSLLLPDAQGNPTPTMTCTTNGLAVTSPVTFPVGLTTVNCTASNIAGTASCDFTVTVVDNDPPNLVCWGDITRVIDPTQTSTIVKMQPSATDACGIVSSIGCAPSSGSSFPLGTNSVTCWATDDSGNTNNCTFSVTVKTGPYDLAVTKIKVLKRVALSGAVPSLTKPARVTIENRSGTQTITSLNGLVTLVAKSLETYCPDAQVTLRNGPPNRPLPVVLKPQQKLTVYFDVTYNCAAVDQPKNYSYQAYSYTASVNQEAVNGEPDSFPLNNNCPRAPIANGSHKDPGCGGLLGGGTYGGQVITEVIIK